MQLQGEKWRYDLSVRGHNASLRLMPTVCILFLRYGLEYGKI